MGDPSERWNLTGVWHGNYAYPHGLGDVCFVATLIDSGHHVSGSTHEPHGHRPETLYATVSGHRAGRQVTFTKVCQGGGEAYSKPIEYRGTLSEDGTEVEGRWIIHSEWSGRFLMIRSGGSTVAATANKSVTA